MDSVKQSTCGDRPSGSAGDPGDAPGWLLPVLSRVLRLGRGPGGLAEWVREKQGRPGGPADPAFVRRLAAELGRCLTRSAATTTRADRLRQTVRAR